jgi:Domain of unknown function (DUF5122) beta-propeller
MAHSKLIVIRLDGHRNQTNALVLLPQTPFYTPMKRSPFLLTLMTICHFSLAQIPDALWQVAQDTLTPSVFHFHKNLALSASGLSAALTSRNDLDQLEVYEADGTVRYSVSFADEFVWYYHMQFSTADELYLMGVNQPNSSEGSSLHVQKRDADGNVLWDTNWSSTATEFTGVIRSHLLSDGRLIVAGQYNFVTPNSSNDFYITCLTPQGSIDWTYSYSSVGVIYDILRNSHVDASDNIYFAGIRQNPSLSNYYNLIAGKLNSSGILEWSIDLDYTNFNGQSIECASVVSDTSGDVLIAANTFTYNQQSIPISLPLVVRLGSNGALINITTLSFEHSAVIKELIVDSDSYYANFHSQHDSLMLVAPTIFEVVTVDRGHHIRKMNSNDETVWSYDEQATNSSATLETYNMVWANEQLMVFNYLDYNNRILCLDTDGNYINAYTYPHHFIQIGIYQHHILANDHGMYLLTSSFQTAQGNRPYYHLARFAFGPDAVLENANATSSLFPNPAQQFTHISNLSPTSQVHLFNSMSQEMSIEISGQIIRWSALPNGIYFLEIRDELVREVHRLVIKN